MVEWKTNQTIQELIDEINNTIDNMDEQDKKSWWDDNGTDLPVAEKFEDRVMVKSSYPIWACNDAGDCLVGAGADEIEHIDDIAPVNYTTYIKNTDSIFGAGSTIEESEDQAKLNYITKYPEEEENIDDVEWDTVESINN